MSRTVHFIVFITLLCAFSNIHATEIEPQELFIKKPKRVLVLNSDGTYVMGIAKILDQIETATGKKTYESYDLIVGNSMGGILALYLAQGKSASSFIEDMNEIVGDFYYTTWWKKLLGIKSFSTPIYEKALKKLLGKGPMNILTVPGVITVLDNRYSEHLTISGMDNPNIPIWQVARATTSSEQYSPLRLKLNGINRYITDNVQHKMNMALVAYVVTKKIFPKDQIELVRLDAGKAQSKNSFNGMVDHLIKDSVIDDLNIRLNIRADLLPTDYSDFAMHRIFLTAERAMEFNKEGLIELIGKILDS